jgi:RHS repeat-associated protein
LENKFKYNGKEEQCKEFSDGSGLDWLDYGARMYDGQVGRWQATDGKAELCFNMSPYIYAANTPVNAIDPDGNVVIFINGYARQEKDQGTAEYWHFKQTKYRTEARYEYNFTERGEKVIKKWWGETVAYEVDVNFDEEVSKNLNDGRRRYVHGGTDVIESVRDKQGEEQGYDEAQSIIALLQRTNNVITETIKVITHSMGGAFGKGYVRGLKKYIEEHGLQKEVRITLVADFDPFGAANMHADDDIETMQFTHKGSIANQKQQGKKVKHMETKATGEEAEKHSISSFFNDIGSLKEGRYKWNSDTKKWELQ